MTGLLPGQRTLERYNKSLDDLQGQLDELIQERDGLVQAGIEVDQSIVDFVNESINNTNSGSKKYEVLSLDANDVNNIKQATGLDLTGYKFTLDSDDIRHTFKQHGNPQKEASRGQIAITANDIAMLRDVIRNPDEIEMSPQKSGRDKLDAIYFKKEINGLLYVVEEIRTGKKQIAFKTAYKKISPRGASVTSPDLDVRNGSGTTSNIGSNADQVKTIYTSIPEEWHDQTLYDWGRRGLVTEGKKKIGRRVTFDPFWLDQLKRIKRGENPALIRELRAMTNEVWEVHKRSGKFWNTDHYLASPQAIAEAEARIRQRKITKLDKQIETLEPRVEAARSNVTRTQEFMENAKNYFPRRFLAEEIKANKAEFIAWLKRSWQRNRDIEVDPETGKPVRINTHERAIIDEMRDGMEIPESIRTEGELAAHDQKLFDSYQRQVDDYFQKSAEETFKTITDPGNGHGVESAFNGGQGVSSLMRRRLTVDESDPATAMFLDRSADNIMAAYHHTVGGLIASRRAIQSNPQMLPKGVDIETSDDWLNHMDDQYKQAIQIARDYDKVSGTKYTDLLLKDYDTTMKRLKRGIMRLEGRHIGDSSDGANAMFTWAGQQLMTMNYLSMLGSQTLSAVNDIASMVLFSDITSIPRNVKLMTKAMAPLKQALARVLKMLGIAFEGEQARAMSMFDVDFEDSRLGVGHGMTRKITSGISDINSRMSAAFNEISLINSWNRYAKRGASMIAMDRVFTSTRRMLKAQALMDSGEELGPALRKAGISRFDYAQMKEMGIDIPTARTMLDYMRRFGTDENGKALADLDPEDLLNYKGIVLSNADEWLKADGDAARSVFDTYANAINLQVNRMMVVTPGIMDKPLMCDNWFGRAFNQFSTFGFAWANQVARPMAQRPGGKIIAGIGAYFAIGAMVDAMRNHLSGRRDFDETIARWTDNPLGMTYNVVHTSGLSGWLVRPMAVSDKMGIGPGSWIGADGATTSRAAYRADSLLGSLSPVADTIERNYRGLSRLTNGGWDEPGAWHTLRKSVPFQNLLWLRASNRYLGFDPLLTEQMMQRN